MNFIIDKETNRKRGPAVKMVTYCSSVSHQCILSQNLIDVHQEDSYSLANVPEEEENSFDDNSDESESETARPVCNFYSG